MSGYLLKFKQRYSVKIGGRKYPVVKIGNQLWMAENLDWKFTGCDIAPAGSPSTPSAWYYNNDEVSYGIDGTYKCGLLYNWYAAKYIDDNKATLLPDGWHVPSFGEYETLCTVVAPEGAGYHVNYKAGRKLRAIDGYIVSSSPIWPSDWNGNDESGFHALPAGSRDYYGNFSGLNDYSCIWSITPVGKEDNIYYFQMWKGEESASYSAWGNKLTGFSIRLVKDLT